MGLRGLRGSTYLAVALASVSVLLSLATGGLALAGGVAPETSLPDLIAGWMFGSTPCVFAPLAAVICIRRPTNRVGWLLGLGALCIAGSQCAQAYAVCALLVYPGRLPLGEVAVWIGNTTWPLVWAPLLLLLLVFPTGTLQSPRWRKLAWAVVLFAAVQQVVAAVVPGPMPLSGTVNTSFDNPTGLSLLSRDVVLHALLGPAFGVQLALLLATVVGMLLRFWRSTGVEQLQLKWLLFAATIFLAAEVLTTVGVFGDWGQVVSNVAAVGIPLAITTAIVRYRLFDIDVVINRALVYGVVSVVLLVAYWLGVILLQRALRPFTSSSELALIGSTVGIVALFQPVRREVQIRVDRRFYRHRYDAVRAVDAFTARLRHEMDLDTLSTELMNVIEDTVRPARLSVWLRPSATPRSHR